MSDWIFPSLDRLDVDVTRTQSRDTRVHREAGGRCLTLANRSTSIYRWALTYSSLRTSATYATDDLLRLQDFFQAHGGRRETFLFACPLAPSFPTTDFPGITTVLGDGARTVFDLCTPWGEVVGAASGSPAIAIYKGGTLQASGYTLSSTLGRLQVTFSVAPTAGAEIWWTGGFQWRARFVSDDLQIKRVVSGLYSAQIEIESVILP